MRSSISCSAIHIATFFGTALNPDGSSYLPMGDSYFNRLVSHDRQIAGFGEVNFKLTDTLKLTAGVRVSKISYTIESLSGGPQNSGPRPGTQSNSETPVTPKAGIQWQVDPNNLYYFTYAKGFRSGGGNPSIPYDPTFQNPNVGCTQDFLNFGIPDAPATYKSDSVQSFEVGAKNNIDNRVRLASSIYYIKWNNIQGNVVPPICQIQFTDNLGNAVSKGFDLQADFQVTDAFAIESASATPTRATPRTRSRAARSPPARTRRCRWWSPAMRSPGRTASAPATRFRPTRRRLAWNTNSSAFAHESFVRGDYEYLAGDKWVHRRARIRTRPPMIRRACRRRGRAFASLRAGTNFGDWGVSLFVDNLTDTHTIVNYNHQTNSIRRRRQPAGESRVPVHFLSSANHSASRSPSGTRGRARGTRGRNARRRRRRDRPAHTAPANHRRCLAIDRRLPSARR